MSANTAIAWCDSTFNPWIGCTKVSVGAQGACENCYAEDSTAHRSMAKRSGVTSLWVGGNRYRTSAAYWRQPGKWNDEPFHECPCGHWRGTMKEFPPHFECPVYLEKGLRDVRRRVFCASLADVFDNEVDPQWRRDLFDVIETTPRLTWLLLTKRIGNVMRMLPSHDWLSGQRNVLLGITVGNQDEADRDVPKLQAMLACGRFISYEPALSHVLLSEHLERGGIHQVIVGGESGPKARPFHAEWARTIVAECHWYGVAPFVKQMGAVVYDTKARADDWPNRLTKLGSRDNETSVRVVLNDKKGGDMAEWPVTLRVREFPEVA